MESDFIYFRRRAFNEREAALHARHPQARERHLDMARLYDERLRAIAAPLQGFGLRLVTSA